MRNGSTPTYPYSRDGGVDFKRKQPEKPLKSRALKKFKSRKRGGLFVYILYNYSYRHGWRRIEMLRDNGQMKLSLSPYQGLYDIIIPEDNLLRKIKENIDFSFVNPMLRRV